MTLLLAAGSSTSGGGVTLLLPLVLMGGIFYFLLVRPQQKRTRAQRNLQESLDVGDEVITIGGIFGVVRDIDDEAITVEISPGTQVRMVRNAISRKLVDEDDDAGSEDERGAGR